MSKVFLLNHERPEIPLQEAVGELVRHLREDEARHQQRQPQAQPPQGFNPALMQQQVQQAHPQHQQQQQQQLQQAQAQMQAQAHAQAQAQAHQAQAQAQAQAHGQAQFQPQNHFLSPAQAAHSSLPGANNTASPALMSNHGTPAMQNLALQQPHPNSMGAPAPPGSVSMAHQASFQGTNPSAAGTPAAGSANASPNVNVTGKKRRASGVNIGIGEDGMDGTQVNGTASIAGGQMVGNAKTMKQSPRVGGKRQKGNP